MRACHSCRRCAVWQQSTAASGGLQPGRLVATTRSRKNLGCWSRQAAGNRLPSATCEENTVRREEFLQGARDMLPLLLGTAPFG